MSGNYYLANESRSSVVVFSADLKGSPHPSVMVNYKISGEIYAYEPKLARKIWNDLVAEGYARISREEVYAA